MIKRYTEYSWKLFKMSSYNWDSHQKLYLLMGGAVSSLLIVWSGACRLLGGANGGLPESSPSGSLILQ